MMRFAAEAARHLPRAEIVELHHETKKDAPSGTAKATAERDRRRPADPLRPPAGPRRAPGGAPRRAGPAADDPPRHDLPRGVRPGRPARARAAARSPAGPDGRPRRAALNLIRAGRRRAARHRRASVDRPSTARSRPTPASEGATGRATRWRRRSSTRRGTRPPRFRADARRPLSGARASAAGRPAAAAAPAAHRRVDADGERSPRHAARGRGSSRD